MPQSVKPEVAPTGSGLAGEDLDAGQVERIVNRVLGGGPNSARHLRVVGPRVSTAFSRIFRGEGDVFPCPVAIKLFRQPQFDITPSDAARTYHLALTQLAALGGDDPAFGVVRPFGLIEDHALVVAEWIDGPPLSSWLRHASRTEARQAVRRAGIWLARLQRASGLIRRPMDVGLGLERLDETMDGASRRTWFAGVFRAAYLLHMTAGKLANDGVLWSPSHGDFKPVNLIVRAGRVFGIDLDLTGMAPTVHDVGHFLNHLRLLCYSPRGLRLVAQMPMLETAFCEGYTVEGALELPPRILAWERLRHAMNLLLREREWSRPPRSWLASIALYRLVRQLSDDLVRVADNHQASPSDLPPSGGT